MSEQELQQAFISYLSQKYQVAPEQIEALAQQLGQEGLKQEYAEFMQLLQQQQQGMVQQGAIPMQRMGGAINYLRQLRGECPTGYNLSYYKKGGKLCKKCVKKADDGDKFSKSLEKFNQKKKSNKTQEYSNKDEYYIDYRNAPGLQDISFETNQNPLTKIKQNSSTFIKNQKKNN